VAIGADAGTAVELSPAAAAEFRSRAGPRLGDREHGALERVRRIDAGALHGRIGVSNGSERRGDALRVPTARLSLHAFHLPGRQAEIACQISRPRAPAG